MRESNNNQKIKNKMFADRLLWLQWGFVIAVFLFIIYLFSVQVLDVRHFRVHCGFLIKAKRKN